MAEKAPGNGYQIVETGPGEFVIIYDSLDSGDTAVATYYEAASGDLSINVHDCCDTDELLT